MAKLLPTHISIRDNEVLGEHFAWKGAPPNCSIGETEWLYVMHLVEQTIKDDEELVEKYWLALYDATESTRWPYDADFNQRATAMCKVKGVEV